jgi:hypothetical protein
MTHTKIIWNKVYYPVDMEPEDETKIKKIATDVCKALGIGILLERSGR